MKIAQIVCAFPPYKGGIGNSVYGFSRHLAKTGAYITVFTPNYQHIGAEYNEDFNIRRINPLFKIGNAAFIPQIFFKLKEYDAIHLHLPFIGATCAVWFYSVLHPQKKLIVHYHMDLVGRGAKKIIFWLYKKIILPFILRRADKIIVSSFDYLEGSDIKIFFNKNKNKFFELPFGVDTHKFYPKPKDRALLGRYFIEPQDKIILFVGGLDKAHYFKGLDILMKAVKEINNGKIKLMVAGDGELKASFKDLAENLYIGSRVIFAGGVPDFMLNEYYNLADIFVLPSVDKSEAFGLVLLEAASCGKPLIASDLKGVRTLIRDGENGFLFEVKNSHDLAEKIKSILRDGDLAEKMAAASRQMAENNYDWDIVIKKLIEIYRR